MIIPGKQLSDPKIFLYTKEQEPEICLKFSVFAYIDPISIKPTMNTI